MKFVTPKKINKSDYRFIEFLRIVKQPITEEQIIKYWEKNIMLTGGTWESGYGKDINGLIIFKWVPYSPSKKKLHALNWFDRSLGRAIRRELIATTLQIQRLN